MDTSLAFNSVSDLSTSSLTLEEQRVVAAIEKRMEEDFVVAA
jgi:hypothetical protein